MVGDGMKAGGLGLSTGLYYAPGSYAKTEEIVALAKVAAELGGVYSSHIRDEADYTIGVVAAVDEVIGIAEEAHIRAVVSHMKALGPANWGKSEQLVERIERARARGVQVFADQYAYEASGTGIVAALDSALGRGRRPRGDAGSHQRQLTRRRVRDAIAKNIARRGGADKLVISDYAADHALERSVARRDRSRQIGVAGGSGRARCSSKATRPGVVQHVRRRHRADHAAALDDDVHGRRPDGARARQAASARLWRLRAEARGVCARSPHHRPASMPSGR